MVFHSTEINLFKLCVRVKGWLSSNNGLLLIRFSLMTCCSSTGEVHSFLQDLQFVSNVFTYSLALTTFSNFSSHFTLSFYSLWTSFHWVSLSLRIADIFFDLCQFWFSYIASYYFEYFLSLIFFYDSMLLEIPCQI